MNLGDKIKKLRIQKQITQEQLAEKLFVSRTAVSKWERNVGYPNLDSLKLIAKEFSISLDELLSNGELIIIAKEENKNTINNFVGLSFAIIDLMALLLIFLPLYGQSEGDYIKSVNLLSLIDLPLFLIISYYIVIGLSILCGVICLIVCLLKYKKAISIVEIASISLSSIVLILFIVTLMPYAASLVFIFILLKMFLVFRNKSINK